MASFCSVLLDPLSLQKAMGHDSTTWLIFGEVSEGTKLSALTETLGIRIEALRPPYVGVLPGIPGTKEITMDILLVQTLERSSLMVI